ncbi:hypothetical protein QBC37DRAFT_304685 [Rhypophila decipiens]|uniref:THIF-type NAD/FAD binding fold domain-containing protein n=1 Tax=Rhypophila decipiens TaxID=261697 RepID=A0AAN6YJS5_9PEZI|nr:hypothetical protein QBC37DRAFT_304685 [Rhypophila decipiens]
MSSLFSQSTSNSTIQLAATAVVSAAVAAGAVLSYQHLQQGEKIYQLKQSIPSPHDHEPAPKVTKRGPLPEPDKDDEHGHHLAERALKGDIDDELILEQLARNRVFLGPEGLEKLRNSFVVVVGCGGVGSHAAAALARSGVSKLRLIDFDQVSLSSLNRHAVAILADVGSPKVECLSRRLLDIAPWVQFDLRMEKMDGKSAASLLGGWKGTGHMPDFVIDAIDNIDSKVDLLKYCWDHQLPVISSMGAGTKSDPTRIMVGDIGTSTDDGLSRATRRRLKLLGITSGIPVVFSTEQMGEGKAALLPLPEEQFQKGSVGELGVISDFRVRILPVLGTMPAVFGYTVANHVILKITGYPIDYIPGKGRDKMYDGILAFIQSSEEKIIRQAEGGSQENCLGLKVPVTTGDIAFLAEELYKGRSVVTGIPTKLVLIRWEKPTASTLIRIKSADVEQKSSDLKLSDLVCMTKEEATRHLKEIILGDKTHKDLYDEAVIEKVEARRQEAKAYERFR